MLYLGLQLINLDISLLFKKFDNQVRICMAKLPKDFTLSGLKKGHASVTVITGSGFDVEA